MILIENKVAFGHFPCFHVSSTSDSYIKNVRVKENNSFKSLRRVETTINDYTCYVVFESKFGVYNLP